MNTVKWCKLGDVCEFKKGKSITKKQAVESGKIPVVAGGQTPAYYHNESNREPPCISVAASGAYSGFVAFWDEPIFLSDAFSIAPNDELNIRYLFHFLTSKQQEIYWLQRGAGVPHVYADDLKEWQIPIPPLDEQSRIVGVLDRLEAASCRLINVLEQELSLRTKQYNYYREQLLSASNLPSCSWHKLGEVCEIKSGYTPLKSKPEYWSNGHIPWFRVDDIRTNGTMLSDAMQKITPAAVKKAPFKANSLIISTSATIGAKAIITVPFVCNQRFLVLYPNENLNLKFLFYMFDFLQPQLERMAVSSGAFASITQEEFSKLQITIPPLDEQSKIVGILDNYTNLKVALLSKISAEIKERAKQARFYKEQLLNFKSL